MRTDRRLHIEAILRKERERATRDLRQIEEDEAEAPSVSGGDVSRTEWTTADNASDVQEEEGDFITATRLSARLADIDEALRLLDKDPEAFARCVRCGSEIEATRQEFVPWSRMCASCARLNGRIYG
jgi:RNA polymerase-binding transcription factor DksA